MSLFPRRRRPQAGTQRITTLPLPRGGEVDLYQRPQPALPWNLIPPPGHQPIDKSEIIWARNRQPRHRTPIPRSGDQVYYRHEQWADPTLAQVVRIVDPLPEDLNVFESALNTTHPTRHPLLDGIGHTLMVLRPDPDYEVELHTAYGRVVTREARVRGSAGWLPLDWTTRWRPNGPLLDVGR